MVFAETYLQVFLTINTMQNITVMDTFFWTSETSTRCISWTTDFIVIGGTQEILEGIIVSNVTWIT